MGLLVGLPLGIFRILAAVFMLAVRFGLPLLALFFLRQVVKRRRQELAGAA